jgi:hypothetical protein
VEAAVAAAVAGAGETELAFESIDWPKNVLNKWKEKYPWATPQDCEDVSQGLKDWFALIRSAHPRRLGMPSRSVDLLWHELILETRFYERFCRECVGFFVHHSSNESDTSEPAKEAQKKDVMRTWMGACMMENIDPMHPERLPRLFRLDEQVGDEKGFKFNLLRPSDQDATNPTEWFE